MRSSSLDSVVVVMLSVISREFVLRSSRCLECRCWPFSEARRRSLGTKNWFGHMIRLFNSLVVVATVQPNPFMCPS